jgi:formate dehydrogenase subunit gamma
MKNRLLRFDRTERIVHWVNATGFIVLILTGASLKLAGLSTVVGNRHMVKEIHVWTGLLLPIPLLLALAVPAGRMLRADFKRFNRWSRDDRRWFRRSTRGRLQLGKFNPGQKLNAVFIGAALVVQLMTGAIMYWFKPFPDSWRTGATFVHDSTWLVLIVVIIGHIIFALRDPDSMRSMLKGWVPQSWARRERPVWWAEQVADAELLDAAGDVEART